MSSDPRAKTLLAALSEVDNNPASLGFLQTTFTVFNQQSPSPAVSNPSTRASSSTEEDVEVISSDTSSSSSSSAPKFQLILSPQHRDPQTYDRTIAKAIPKKASSPGKESAATANEKTWNGTQVQKHEVKHDVLSTGADRRQQQTTPVLTQQVTQVAARNWRYANSNSSSKPPVQEHAVSVLTIPHTAAATISATGNFANNQSQNVSSVASNCSTTIQGGNNSVVSSTQSVATLSTQSEDTPQKMEVGVTESGEEGNVTAAPAAKSESKESSESCEIIDQASSPKEEPMEALCSNCGIWSMDDRYCLSCQCDFTQRKPKKTRPRTIEFIPAPRQTFRKGTSKKIGNSVMLSPIDSSSKPRYGTGTTSHGTSILSTSSSSMAKVSHGTGVSNSKSASGTSSHSLSLKSTTAVSPQGSGASSNPGSALVTSSQESSKSSCPGSASAENSHGTSQINTSTGTTGGESSKSNLVRINTFSSAFSGFCVKPHPTTKQRYIIVKNPEEETKPVSVSTSTPSISAKAFYVNKLAAVSPALPVSTGGIATSSAVPADAKASGAQNNRKRSLKSNGGRRTPAKRAPPKRKEPEIVLISDSEDEEEESAKQKPSAATASEDATESDEELARSFMTVKAKMRDKRGDLVGRPDTQGGKDSTDGHHSLQGDPNSLNVAFNVSILRFGSWPMHAVGTTLRLPAVSMTPDGFQFHFQQSTHKCGKIELLVKDIEKCDHYLSDDGFSTFFIMTTPHFAQVVRSRLAMYRKVVHFDPGSKEEYEKMVVIRSAQELHAHSYREKVQKVLAAMAEKSDNSGMSLKFEPIDKARTTSLLESSTRPEMKGTVFITRPNNGSHAATLNSADRPVSITMQQLTRLGSGQGAVVKTKASSEDQVDNKLFVYPPPPKFGGITVTTEDRDCLEEGEFLNDVIIDFYLKYIVMEKLSDVDRERTHLFSCFFYKRLLQQDTRGNISPDLNGLTPKEKRHQKVRKWTRHVDIFAKDFIIIPINDCAHWFVAIICFAGDVINMKKGNSKSPSQSPSPSSSNQPSPASAASPATPSPATPSRATPSPSEQPANHNVALNQAANHGNPGVQAPASQSSQSSKSPSGQTTKTVHDTSQSANRMAEAAHVGQQPATQGSNSTNEEEPMDTSESPDERMDDHESERTTRELKENTNDPSDNPLNKSLGNSTEALKASNSTTASEKVTSDSAISSSKPDPKTQPTQSPAVNGGAAAAKGHLLDFDYQQYHVGKQKNFRQPCILVFDSLAGPPRRNVIAKLRDYLTIEWEKKKGGKCEFTTANMKGMNPKIPQQNNFSDCGLYVCQYVETFFEKPIRNYHSPMRGLQNWFPEEVVARKRQEICNAIKALHESYKARR
ncbi:uncharacterized protein LOC121413803 isoform X3 [Lytechinus variegatus]|uniref:uncharacterized protein LOC121413803 isoform X3 n=1 Tax=Lytechinus variegatus TaxID=7654 RepID=UPI001BB23D36|nr:uncharacterized protein LOC121413803 isoform X3 [Lytechinus variegatus]